jgi:hypothetical protein
MTGKRTQPRHWTANTPLPISAPLSRRHDTLMKLRLVLQVVGVAEVGAQTGDLDTWVVQHGQWCQRRTSSGRPHHRSPGMGSSGPLASAGDVATADPPVGVGPQLPLELHQAPDLGAVDPQVGLDVVGRLLDCVEVDA